MKLGIRWEVYGREQKLVFLFTGGRQWVVSKVNKSKKLSFSKLLKAVKSPLMGLKHIINLLNYQKENRQTYSILKAQIIWKTVE